MEDPSSRPRGKTESIKQRRVDVYLNTLERKERWNEFADEADGNLVADRSTTLVNYAAMDEEDRRELLNNTARMAVAIYNHWDEMAY